MGRSTHPEDDKNFGDPLKYDPDFNGPLKGRSCTDIICLLLFLVFMICWIAIGIFAITKGDPNSLLIPKDSEKRRCGHDSEVIQKPYLFFIDITKCLGPNVAITGCQTQQVCVDKCPDDFFSYEIYKLNSSALEIKNKIICSEGIKENIKTSNDIEKFIADGKCTRWYVPSTSVLKRCVFLDFPPQYAGLNEDKARLLKNKVTVGLSWLSLSVQNTVAKFTNDTSSQQIVTQITEDIIHSWWKILIGLGISLVICLIYIFLMRWVAAWVVWFSLLGIVALLSYGVYYTADTYKTLKNGGERRFLSKVADSVLQDKNVWLAFLIILSVLLAFTLLVLIFLRKRIVIAIAIIKEGSKAVGACLSSLFFPIFPWILQILVLAYAVASGLYLSSIGDLIYKVHNMSDSCVSCGNYKNDDICDPMKFKQDCDSVGKLYSACADAICKLEPVQNPAHIKIFHAVNVVGGFWGVFFVSAFGEMVLAATFATWYWTFKKTNVPFFTVSHAIYRTLRYHVGTLAFGSLIITICRLIRIAIEYIDHKLKKYNNPVVRAILCCCKCFFWCLENFLKFINRNAYIMCAIHGKNFCGSAKDAFSLLMRNILRVFVIDKVTDLLFFLGKILITACVATVAYTAFTNDNYVDASDIHYRLVPVVLISIGAFLISNVFFGVYSMAVDTLFLCFLEDSERNDGSTEKPYYMSKELMKILGKKNKKVK